MSASIHLFKGIRKSSADPKPSLVSLAKQERDTDYKNCPDCTSEGFCSVHGCSTGCGGVILADTEDYKKPLCDMCYEIKKEHWQKNRELR